MILDSSAIVAMYLEEPGHEVLDEAVERARLVLVGAPTVLETAMVLSPRLHRNAYPEVAGFLESIGVKIVPFTEEHTRAAVAAFLRFGRGHHPARLNFGDCMSYAMASESGLPLLCTGNDFAQTDIPLA